MPVEIVANSQERLAIAAREPSSVSSYDRAMELIIHRIGFKDRVAFEGAPFYLFPSTDPDYSSQQWDHEGFQASWSFINEAASVAPDKSQPFVLIDEFNNTPEGYTNRQFMQHFAIVLNRAPQVLLDSAIARPHTTSLPAIYRLESDYAVEGARNRCGNLDAGFQKDKVIFSLQRNDMDEPADASEVNLEDLGSVLLVVAHPVEFQHQQTLMLYYLMRELEQMLPESDLQRRAKTKSLLGQAYVHVWFDAEGDLVSITHPVWNNKEKNFIHEELE